MRNYYDLSVRFEYWNEICWAAERVRFMRTEASEKHLVTCVGIGVSASVILVACAKFAVAFLLVLCVSLLGHALAPESSSTFVYTHILKMDPASGRQYAAGLYLTHGRKLSREQLHAIMTLEWIEHIRSISYWLLPHIMWQRAIVHLIYAYTRQYPYNCTI